MLFFRVRTNWTFRQVLKDDNVLTSFGLSSAHTTTSHAFHISPDFYNLTNEEVKLSMQECVRCLKDEVDSKDQIYTHLDFRCRHDSFELDNSLHIPWCRFEVAKFGDSLHDDIATLESFPTTPQAALACVHTHRAHNEMDNSSCRSQWLAVDSRSLDLENNSMNLCRLWSAVSSWILLDVVACFPRLSNYFLDRLNCNNLWIQKINSIYLQTCTRHLRRSSNNVLFLVFHILWVVSIDVN